MGSEAASPVAVSIVVVTYQRRDLLEQCLASLTTAREALDERSELIVVDNGSPGGVSEDVAAHDDSATVVRLDPNVGFSGAVGHGIDRARGEWIALFNDDTTLEPDALVELIGAGRSAPDVGSVAAQIRFSKNPETINSAGIVIDRLGITADRLLGEPVTASETEAVEVFGTAATAAVYRREVLEEVDGFDPTFYAHLEDADVAWRARMLGWRCLYAPSAVVYHHHAATLSHFSDEKYFVGGRNRVRLIAKNADRGLLWRSGAAMALYDAGYVVFVAARERTLAPLRGRLAGLREWRTYRRAGETHRRPISLPRSGGIRAALRRRSIWSRSTSVGKPGAARPAGEAPKGDYAASVSSTKRR